MALPAPPSPRVAALLGKMRAASRGRLVFALDATASRQPCWDAAMGLQAEMLAEAAKVGTLAVKLLYFRGVGELQQSPWLSDPAALMGLMSKVSCAAGPTQLARLFKFVSAEHAREKIDVMVYVGDAVEECVDALYALAPALPPTFLFQEGSGTVTYLDRYGEFAGEEEKVEVVFRRIAALAGGAYVRFGTGSAGQLGELLRAAATFAVGGAKALSTQHTDGARKLLGQLKLTSVQEGKT